MTENEPPYWLERVKSIPMELIGTFASEPATSFAVNGIDINGDKLSPLREKVNSPGSRKTGSTPPTLTHLI